MGKARHSTAAPNASLGACQAGLGGKPPTPLEPSAPQQRSELHKPHRGAGSRLHSAVPGAGVGSLLLAAQPRADICFCRQICLCGAAHEWERPREETPKETKSAPIPTCFPKPRRFTLQLSKEWTERRHGVRAWVPFPSPWWGKRAKRLQKAKFLSFLSVGRPAVGAGGQFGSEAKECGHGCAQRAM